MDIRELRVGNIIEKKFAIMYWMAQEGQPEFEWNWNYYRAEEWKEVVAYPDNFRGLVLSAEILERLGFKYVGNDSFMYDDWIMLKVEDGRWDDPCLDFFIKKEEKAEFYITCVTTVHELQNLFYALTATELEWKN